MGLVVATLISGLGLIYTLVGDIVWVAGMMFASMLLSGQCVTKPSSSKAFHYVGGTLWMASDIFRIERSPTDMRTRYLVGNIRSRIALSFF